jgi:Uma2 family endonuclease
MGMTPDVRIPMWPLTVDDFDRMLEAGILDPEDRVELLNGQLAEMTPPSPEHAGLVQWLAQELICAIKVDVARVRVRSPLRFAPVSEPEPDIAIVAPGRYTREHPATAMLVIEVAKTSLPIDLGTKAEIYAAAEVPEYWVVDIVARALHVHASPGPDGYGSIQRVTGGDLQPQFPGAPTVNVETLFSLLD